MGNPANAKTRPLSTGKWHPIDAKRCVLINHDGRSVEAPKGAHGEGDDFLAARNPLFSELRKIWPNTLITNGGYDRAKADAVIGTGLADMVAFGAPYLSNPDLPERLLKGAAYNEPDRATFYGGGAKGYTDYPALSD